MFGIFYMIYTGIMSSAAKFKRTYDNETNRERARKNGDITYYGHGGEYLVSNNRQVFTCYDKDMNLVLKDYKTGQVYKNYDQEKHIQKISDVKKAGKTVILVDYKEREKYIRTMQEKAKSITITPRYKDIYTSRYYTVVYINCVGFYMDIINGNIIRPIDEEDYSRKIGKVSIDMIISKFNERQMKLLNSTEKKSSMWWDEVFYLDIKQGYNLFIDDDNNIIEGDRWNKEVKERRLQLVNKGE